MAADAGQHFGFAHDRRQDAFADVGCSRTIRLLRRSAMLRLVEDGLGDADLADVVQLGGQTQQLALFPSQP